MMVLGVSMYLEYGRKLTGLFPLDTDDIANNNQIRWFDFKGAKV